MYTEVTAWRAFRDSATEIADNSAPFVYQKSNPTSCILLPNEIVTMLVVVLDQLSQFFEVLQCYLVFLGTQIGPCHENASLTWSGNRLHLTSRYSRTWSVNVSLATNPSAFFLTLISDVSPSSGDANPRAEMLTATRENTDELVSASSPASHLPNPSNSRQVYGSLAAWTNEDVAKWLTRFGLSAYEKPLSDLDGPLLAELARLRLAAPESLSFSLRCDLNMGLIDQLRLHRALALLAFESQSGS